MSKTIWNKSRKKLDQLFLYRHVQTSQVLVTIGRVMMSRHLKQIKDAALRPHQFRKDHWTPFIAISGFSSYSSIMTANNLLFHNMQNRPKSPKYYETEKRIRVHEDMDLVETSVLGLCTSLRGLEERDMESEKKKKKSLLKIYWERMAMVDLPKEKLGLDWPNFVQHEKLELKRDRFFMNDELKLKKKSFAEKKDMKDARLKRGAYAKKKEDQENQVKQVNKTIRAGKTSDVESGVKVMGKTHKEL